MTKQRNILLVDDDKNEHFFFARALEDIPMEINLISTYSGEETIDYLIDTAILPDVIFLDLNMIGMDGVEALEIIRSRMEWAHIPVVIYSTSFDEFIVDTLYQKGANYYLQKPNFVYMAYAIHKILTTIINKPGKPSRKDFVVTFSDRDFIEGFPLELPA